MSEWRSLSRADFKTWHTKYKADNGYPLPGRNALTGELQPLTVGPTTDYAAPLEVDAADVRVTVDEKSFLRTDDEGVITDTAPGVPSWAPAYNDDGTVDIVKSKIEPVPAEYVKL